MKAAVGLEEAVHQECQWMRISQFKPKLESQQHSPQRLFHWCWAYLMLQVAHYSSEDISMMKREFHTRKKKLQAVAERLGLSKGDRSICILGKIGERSVWSDKMSEDYQGNKSRKLERHQQWMRAVNHIPADKPCHAHTMEWMVHQVGFKQIRTAELLCQTSSC